MKSRFYVFSTLTLLVFCGCSAADSHGAWDETNDGTPSAPSPGGKADGTGEEDNLCAQCLANESADDCARVCSRGASCQGLPSSMEYIEVCGPTRNANTVCKCISRLVMGTDHLGNFWEQHGFPENEGQTSPEQRKANAMQMLDYAVAKGITLFDTSPIYADGIENTLGNWIQLRKQEDPAARLFTLTKGGFPIDIGPGTYDSRLTGDHQQMIENIAEEIRWSYSNLHGQIDFYLMHRDDVRFVNYQNMTYQDEYGNPRTQTPVEDILAVLSDDTVYPDVAHLGGRSLRSHYDWIGVSNWKTDRVDDALWAPSSNPDLLKPKINSPYFSLFEMSPTVSIHSGGVQVTHEEMMDRSFQSGILVMPYSPLGGFPILDKGTPEHNYEDAWANAKELAKSLDNNQDRYWGNVYEAIFTPENEARFHRVHAISQKEVGGRRYTIDQWLNAYALAHPRVDLLAVGPIYKEHIDRTAEALSLAQELRFRSHLLDWLHHGTEPVDQLALW